MLSSTESLAVARRRRNSPKATKPPANKPPAPSKSGFLSRESTNPSSSGSSSASSSSFLSGFASTGATASAGFSATEGFAASGSGFFSAASAAGFSGSAGLSVSTGLASAFLRLSSSASFSFLSSRSFCRSPTFFSNWATRSWASFRARSLAILSTSAALSDFSPDFALSVRETLTWSLDCSAAGVLSSTLAVIFPPALCVPCSAAGAAPAVAAANLRR